MRLVSESLRYVGNVRYWRQMGYGWRAAFWLAGRTIDR